MSKDEEKEVVSKAQQGDKVAFETLFLAHKKKIYCLCLKLVREVNLAEDLTQETFFMAFRKLDTFEGRSAFTTWLYRIALNIHLINRRKKFLTTEPLEDLYNSTDEGTSKKYIFGMTDQFLEKTPERVTLEKLINELPHGYRQNLILHDINGYEHNEVAKILGITVGASKSQLFKARERMRDFLRKANFSHTY